MGAGVPRREWRDLVAHGVIAAIVAFAGSDAAWGQVRPVPIRQSDVAFAYMRFEKALASHPVEPSTLAELNREFDRAVGQFFSGDPGQATRYMNVTAWQIITGEAPSPIDCAMLSLIGRFDPPIAVRGEDQEVTLDLRPLYAHSPDATEATMEPTESIECTLRIVRTSSYDVLHSEETRIAVGSLRLNADHTLSIPLIDAPVGDYRLELDWGGPVAWQCGRFHILPADTRDLRKQLAAELDEIASNHPELSAAVGIARSQLRLLNTTPSTAVAAEFLVDQAELVEGLQRDVAALQAGEHPYRQRSGSFWRVCRHNGGDWPYRIEAPQAARDGTPLPFVIALHGAGGNEHMFRFGYGAGALVELAEREGFLVATPLTYPLITAPELVDALIDEVKALYEIADERIYLLGHSLGGGAATAVLNRQPERFAAACGIAGFGRLSLPEDADVPPLLIVAGELDPIVTADRLRTLADEARERGAQVEFRSLPDRGHTLIVGEALPEAIRWLLQHTRDTRSAEP